MRAYEIFLRARSLRGGASRVANRKRLLERVIELDPNFAGGYAGLALTYASVVRTGRSASPKEDIERTFALAQKAVATDDIFVGSYMALGDA